MDPSEGGRAGPEPAADPGAEAAAHLQQAVLELIGAARATLDAVERVVAEPEGLAPVVETAAEVGRVLSRVLRGAVIDAAGRGRAAAGRAGSGGPEEEAEPAPGGRGGRDPGSGSVERIRIS